MHFSLESLSCGRLARLGSHAKAASNFFCRTTFISRSAGTVVDDAEILHRMQMHPIVITFLSHGVFGRIP